MAERLKILRWFLLGGFLGFQGAYVYFARPASVSDEIGMYAVSAAVFFLIFALNILENVLAKNAGHG